MTEQAFAIFSGYNMRAVIAFCRFARANAVPVFIIASGENDPIYRTDYKAWVVTQRTGRELDCQNVAADLERLMQERACRRLHVLPSSEFLNRFFLRHRAFFSERKIEIPLCSAELYDRISDKESFCALCRAEGLAVPEELDLKATRDYPIVIKPKTYFDARAGTVQFRPKLIFNHEEHLAALAGLDEAEAYAQRYVRGRSVYLLYYISRAGNHVVFAQENLIQQSGGRSMVGAIYSGIFKDKIAEDYLDFLVRAGFTGLVMVELREENGQYCMIEANPRLWGPSQFFLDCRVPIFERFALELGYELSPSSTATPSAAPVEEARYFWGGGIEPGESVALHNYLPEQFLREFQLWQKTDVLLRSDTLDYYFHEISS